MRSPNPVGLFSFISSSTAAVMWLVAAGFVNFVSQSFGKPVTQICFDRKNTKSFIVYRVPVNVRIPSATLPCACITDEFNRRKQDNPRQLEKKFCWKSTVTFNILESIYSI